MDAALNALHPALRDVTLADVATATQPERGRATDELTLNSHGARAYRAGEMISEWQAVMRCAGQ